MINLMIETENKLRAGDLENAYNNALKTCNVPDFINSLMDDMPETIIGRGANHIFIAEKNGNRIGIITNI